MGIEVLVDWRQVYMMAPADGSRANEALNEYRAGAGFGRADEQCDLCATG